MVINSSTMAKSMMREESGKSMKHPRYVTPESGVDVVSVVDSESSSEASVVGVDVFVASVKGTGSGVSVHS